MVLGALLSLVCSLVALFVGSFAPRPCCRHRRLVEVAPCLDHCFVAPHVTRSRPILDRVCLCLCLRLVGAHSAPRPQAIASSDELEIDSSGSNVRRLLARYPRWGLIPGQSRPPCAALA